MSERTALVAGATGHVGRQCVELLLKDDSYSHVIALVRRPLKLAHPKLTCLVVDFDRLHSVEDRILTDDLFLCLGTTSSATTDRTLYHKIDVEYPCEIAAAAKRNGARTVCVVTSLGADPKSGQWYLRLKGELEEQITGVGFESTNIFRPSLIDGRTENRRLKEILALSTINFCSFLFRGRSRRFLPMSGELIAHAMITAAKAGLPGVYTSDRLKMLDLLGLPH